ncbi:MAG: hypothetical protein RBS39_08815 [Phycisphaerales bacterium]|nr:hypothetical protein [Phycisphaerales bacterium]
MVWLAERGSLRVEITVEEVERRDVRETSPDAADAARIERAWAGLVALNPKYHDAPMMALASLDIGTDGTAQIALRRESYKRFAVQDAPEAVQTGVTLVSVTGRLTIGSAGGSMGGTSLVLGLRHARTRVYAGTWEHAPSGGLDAARFVDGSDARAAVLDQLAQEAREELGIEAGALRGLECVGLVHDPRARSLDVVVGGAIAMDRAEFDAAMSARSWEYADVRVMDVDAFRAWMEREPAAINPQTLALERALVARGAS